MRCETEIWNCCLPEEEVFKEITENKKPLTLSELNNKREVKFPAKIVKKMEHPVEKTKAVYSVTVYNISKEPEDYYTILSDAQAKKANSNGNCYVEFTAYNQLSVGQY